MGNNLLAFHDDCTPGLVYMRICLSMREGSGKKTAVACVLNLLVTSTTAACIPALHIACNLVASQAKAPSQL